MAGCPGEFSRRTGSPGRDTGASREGHRAVSSECDEAAFPLRCVRAGDAALRIQR